MKIVWKFVFGSEVADEIRKPPHQLFLCNRISPPVTILSCLRGTCAGFKFLVLTLKCCSNARSNTSTLFTKHFGINFIISPGWDEAVWGGQQSFCLLYSPGNYFIRFVGPHHSTQVVFKVWSLDMLEMQILRPNPRTYRISSGVEWGWEFSNKVMLIQSSAPGLPNGATHLSQEALCEVP